MDPNLPPLSIFMTVGMDHHPFDRALRWFDEWLEKGRAGDAEILVQTGASSVSVRAPSQPALDHAQMRSVLARASIVITHGGATVLEARRLGLIPIVVPRLARFGEVVDDHQVHFAERMKKAGEVRVARSAAQFHGLLDEAIADPSRFRAPPTAAPGVDRFRDLVGDPDRGRVPVLYIGGMGRSGTTLLERMIAEVPGTVSVGELVFLWERGLVGNELCSCGQRFLECPFWSSVGTRAFGGWGKLNARMILELRHRIDRQRHIPRLVARRTGGDFGKRLDSLASLLDHLYRAVQEVSDSCVIIDSSKHASYAFLLRHVESVDLRIVQMVRDSRGVSASLKKTVLRPEVVDTEAYMNQWTPAKTGVHWASHNTFIELAGALGVPTMLLRYEDLLDQPRTQLQRVLDFAGHPAGRGEELSFLSEDSVTLRRGHSISGNPMRFREGTIPLRRDESWRESLQPSDRRVVAALTLPLLRRYGYFPQEH